MDQLASCGLLMSVCILVLFCKMPTLLHNLTPLPDLCTEQVTRVRDTAAALEGLAALSCDWPEAGRGRVWVTSRTSLCSFALCFVPRATFPFLCLSVSIYISIFFYLSTHLPVNLFYRLCISVSVGLSTVYLP